LVDYFWLFTVFTSHPPETHLASLKMGWGYWHY